MARAVGGRATPPAAVGRRSVSAVHDVIQARSLLADAQRGLGEMLARLEIDESATPPDDLTTIRTAHASVLQAHDHLTRAYDELRPQA
jgi:hypothetical protein